MQCGARCESRFRTQKTAALLGYLALFPSRTHPREELAARFWGDDGDEEARRSLRVSLNSLRRQLETPDVAEGALIVADRATIGLRREAFVTDVFRFEDCLTKAARLKRTAPESRAERAALLLQAVNLYGAPLLPGFYDDWLLDERERLHARFLHAIEEAEALLRTLGRDGEADTLALRREQSESSDRVAGTGVVGTPPSVGADSGGRATGKNAGNDDTTADTIPERYAANSDTLPHFFTRFFGRDREMAQLLAYMDDPSISVITLLGTGGIGKTRLSVEAARAWGKSVVWVPLASVVRGEEVADAVRESLKLPAASSGSADGWETLTAHLREQVANGVAPLLMLDNFEQVEQEGGARFVARLLRTVPGVRCLASSRRRLGVPGECLIAVETFPLPDETETDPAVLSRNPCVALFADRARAASADFAVTARNAAAVAGLCRLLDGLPLAIELAAAWASAFTPGQMAGKLAAQGERWNLLASRRTADRAARHRSLWNAIAWSYDLLSPELRTLWRRLSAFHGGFTTNMAETVVGEVFAADGLARLRERSLIRLMEEADGDDPEEIRYELLESLREFAAEQVATEETEQQQADLRGRHLRVLHTLADAGAAYGFGPRTSEFVRRYRRELPNIRLALNHAEAGRVPMAGGLHLATALSRLWRTGYVREGHAYLSALLRRADAENEPVSANVRARALMEQGVLLRVCGETGAAEEPLTAALALFREIGDAVGEMKCLQSLGTLALVRNDLVRAEAFLTSALERGRERRDIHTVATCLNNLGYVADARDDAAAMKRWHEEELSARREIGEENGIALALCGLAVAERGLENRSRSEEYFHEAVALFHRIGDQCGLTQTLYLYAELLVDKSEWEKATMLYGAADALSRKLALKNDGAKAHIESYHARCRAAMGEPPYRECFGRGADLNEDQAVRFALGDGLGNG